MSVTQTIPLEPLRHDQVTFESNPNPTTAPISNFNPTNTDTIIVASRLADAEVPDGGYGWVVACSCSALTFWYVGTTYSWGIIQADLVARNLSSPSTLSFAGGLMTALSSVFALVNVRVIRKIGARSCALIGVGLLSTGQIINGFSTANLGGLFVGNGILGGLGGGLIMMVVITIPTQYFSAKRGLANGMISAVGGLGGACISFAINALLQNLGPKWTFRILGLMILAIGLPAAWLIKERAPITTPTFIEWALFKNTQFTVLFIAGALATFPLFVPPFFLPLYCASVGLSTSTAAGLVAGFNFSSAFGRLCCGLLADRIGPVNTMLLSLITGALSMLAIWPISTSLGPLILFVVINGASNGGFFSTMPTVVGSVFGSRRVGVAMGMILSGWWGGYLMGAPIAGYLLAAYGGEHAGLKAYRPAIFYAGSMTLASAILVLVVKLSISKSPLKKL